MTTITERIREATGGARPGKDGKLTEFAAAIGTTVTTVSRWRDGVIPDPRWRPSLATYFDTTEDAIEQESAGGGLTLDDLAAKLDEILTELRTHRDLLTPDTDVAHRATKARNRAAAQPVPAEPSNTRQRQRAR